MKNIAFIIAGLLLFSISNLSAQEGVSGDFKTKNIVKLNGNYLLHWFSGNSVSLIGVGPEVEISLNEKTSMQFALYYSTRIGEPTTYPQNYTNMVYFTWSGRWYTQEVLNGLYGGVLIGIGLPTNSSVTADLGIQGGYQVLSDRFSFEFGLQAGYGMLRSQSYYGYEPIYDTDWGFYLRPVITIGYGF